MQGRVVAWSAPRVDCVYCRVEVDMEMEMFKTPRRGRVLLAAWAALPEIGDVMGQSLFIPDTLQALEKR